MHKVQIAILYNLRHAQSARFSALMRNSGLESDTFKFHLRKLVSLKYVSKLVTGQYTLTPRGKEFANNLDESSFVIQKQPKLSVLLVVTRLAADGQTLYLFQKRMRNPYYGFWGNIGGPVLWNEEFETTAERELKKQTGLTASFSVKSFYRKKDYDMKTDTMLEDKLFVILEADQIRGELANTWPHGVNQWMTEEELMQQEKYFKSSNEIIDMVRESRVYTSQSVSYDIHEY